MGKKLGDLPTMELAREAVARYARQADADAVQAEAAGERVTRRPEPPPELEISVEVVDAALLDDVPSHFRVRSTDDLDAEESVQLTRVPCIIVCKEDLEWFEMEEASKVVLASIDGESTVESIVNALSLPRDTSLAILGELVIHGVIELQ
jgi:hypothetical protein